MNFTKNHEIREVCAPVAAADDTDQNSDRIDMSGYDGITFIVPITDSVATGVATLTIEQNTLDSDTGMAELEGASATITCVEGDDINNTLLVVEIDRPQERYVQAVLTSTTANIAFGNMIAVLHGPRTKPVSEHASVSDMTLVVEPDEA